MHTLHFDSRRACVCRISCCASRSRWSASEEEDRCPPAKEDERSYDAKRRPAFSTPAFEARDVGPKSPILVHFSPELTRLVANALNHVTAGGDIVPKHRAEDQCRPMETTNKCKHKSVQLRLTYYTGQHSKIAQLCGASLGMPSA